MARTRLDQLLVTRGMVETRTRAQALLMAGRVRVDGQVQTKSGTLVDDECDLVISERLPFASRGGYKLAQALDVSGLSPTGLVALDVGASTGGFTDVLLQRGAARVYALDVGYGLLDMRLRQDERVIPLERTNIRHLEALPEPAQCATIDVSFISLRLVLPSVQRLISQDAWIVSLVKPQFEAGREQVGKGGIVRDPLVHAQVLHDVLETAISLGLVPCGLIRSPITGRSGNVEFLVWFQQSGQPMALEPAIARACLLKRS